jgi:hypothetical protein
VCVCLCVCSHNSGRVYGLPALLQSSTPCILSSQGTHTHAQAHAPARPCGGDRTRFSSSRASSSARAPASPAATRAFRSAARLAWCSLRHSSALPGVSWTEGKHTNSSKDSWADVQERRRDNPRLPPRDSTPVCVCVLLRKVEEGERE